MKGRLTSGFNVVCKVVPIVVNIHLKAIYDDFITRRVMPCEIAATFSCIAALRCA